MRTGQQVRGHCPVLVNRVGEVPRALGAHMNLFHICSSWAVVGPGHGPGERLHLLSSPPRGTRPPSLSPVQGHGARLCSREPLQRGRLPVCNPISVCHLWTGTGRLHHTVTPAATYSSEDACLKHHMTLSAAAMTTADVWGRFDSRLKTKTSHGEAFFFF